MLTLPSRPLLIKDKIELNGGCVRDVVSRLLLLAVRVNINERRANNGAAAFLELWKADSCLCYLCYLRLLLFNSIASKSIIRTTIRHPGAASHLQFRYDRLCNFEGS